MYVIVKVDLRWRVLLDRSHRHQKLLLVDIVAVVFFNYQLGLLVTTDSGVVDSITNDFALIWRISRRHRSFRQHLNVNDSVVRRRRRPLIGLFIRWHNNYVLLLCPFWWIFNWRLTMAVNESRRWALIELFDAWLVLDGTQLDISIYWL